MAWWCYCHGEPCGKDQKKFTYLKEVYLPIKKDNYTYGTIKLIVIKELLLMKILFI